MTETIDCSAAYGSKEMRIERLGESLAFARDTVVSADPKHAAWNVDLGQVSGFEKMMMEAGLLAYLVSRTSFYQEEARSLALAIRSHYDSQDAVSCILRHPRLAASLGTLLLVLNHFGLATPQEVAAVRCAFGSPYAECSEHVPFRLLDRRWVRELATGVIDPLTEALQLSTACRSSHPIYMTREDGYAITHAVMYATDFGTREAPEALLSDGLWETIDAAIAWCTAAADYDLLAELLLSQIYLRRRLSSYGVIAWRRCCMLWDELGFLPSPSISASSFAALTEESERRQYAFHNMYHTMLVGGLLCLAMIEQPLLPPDRVDKIHRYAEPLSVDSALTGAAHHLGRALAVNRATALEAIAAVEWTADESDIDDRIALFAGEGLETTLVTRMAIDASIILAAQDYELSALAAALRRAARSGHATPTVAAGADFLARQSLVDGAIGTAWLGAGKELNAHSDLASARVTIALANCLSELREQLSPSAVAA
jgi:hypothetical protein